MQSKILIRQWFETPLKTLSKRFICFASTS